MSVADPASLARRRFTELNAPEREAAEAELRRVLESAEFRNAPKLIRFLAYVAAKSMDGDVRHLKESVIGIEVFDRAPDWDPKSDSVVRTEARRVRLKLSEFYQNSGLTNGVAIELPKGGYGLRFVSAEEPSASEQVDAAEVRRAETNDRARRPLLWVATGVALAIAAAAFWAWQEARDAHVLTRGIAVAGFRTNEPDLKYVAYSLTAAMQERLSETPGARVVVWRAKDSERAGAADVAAMGRKLGVFLVLTGRVESRPGAGERKALWDAQLIRTSDAAVVWTAQEMVVPDDTRAAEQTMFLSAARALKIAAPRASKGPLDARPVNPKTHDLYLQGRYLWQTRNPVAIEKAIGLYQDALRIDSNCAEAYAGLADAYALLIANAGIASDVGQAKGLAAGKKAVALDPGSSVAHGALGLLAYARWDWNTAEAEYAEALRLNPNYALLYLRLGLVAFAKGDLAQTEKLLGQARDLDPLSASIRATLGQSYFYDRKYDEALDAVRPLIEADPSSPNAREVRMCVWAARGDTERAYREFLQMSRNSQLGAYLGEQARGEFPVLSRGARQARLEEVLRRRKGGAYVNTLDLAAAAVVLSDREATLGFLEEAFHEHVTDLISVRFDPLYAPVWNEPRLHAIYRGMGLE